MSDENAKAIAPGTATQRKYGMEKGGILLFWVSLLVFLINPFWPVSVEVGGSFEYVDDQVFRGPVEEVVNLGRMHLSILIQIVAATLMLTGLVMYFSGRLLDARLDILDALAAHKSTAENS